MARSFVYSFEVRLVVEEQKNTTAFLDDLVVLLDHGNYGRTISLSLVVPAKSHGD